MNDDPTKTQSPDDIPRTVSMSEGGEIIGSHVGPYKLLQEIGEGGMGTVYMAQQAKPVKRRVALKIIKQGMDTKQVVARFEAERQALSMMDHPNIAHVLDVGTTERGRPFFVMELIKGLPITRYCDDKNLNIKRRLQLFQSVCNAVQHAHQKGIIHRDLKPSNILIAEHDGEPVAKIIDFGLAKALHQQLTDKTVFTQLGQVVGTLEYMSPEQSSMNQLEVDTRTDIYSLGVLLYELLTGTVPFDKQRMRSAALDQVLKIIREEEPPKPSLRMSTVESSAEAASHRCVEPKRLGLLLRGDLDWIVMKALEKDRDRRYETANGFGMDIERYINGEPVVAAPPSASYRLKKFVRRNQEAVVAGTLIAVALVVAIFGTSYGMVLANKRFNDAEKARANLEVAEKETSNERDEALATLSFLKNDLLMQAEPEMNAHDSKVTVEELLDRAADRIDHAFSNRPRLAAQLKSTIGQTYQSLGEYDKADPLLDSALKIFRKEVGENDQNTLNAMGDYGSLSRDRGRIKESRELLEEAYERSKSILGARDKTTLQLLNQLALTVKADGDLPESARLCKLCLDTRRELFGSKDRNSLDSLNNYGAVLYAVGKTDEAITAYEECLASMRETLGAEHPSVLVVSNNLAAAYQAIGNLSDAEQMYRDSLVLREKVLGPDHPGVFLTMGNLAVALEMQGQLDESIKLYERCLELGDRIHGEKHPTVLRTRNNLGMALLALGQFDQSGAVFEKCRVGFTEVLGESHPLTLVVQNNLSNSMINTGKYAEAKPLLATATKGLADKLGETHALTMKAFHNQVLLYYGLGKTVEAEHAARKNLIRRRDSLPPAHRDIADSLVVLGKIQIDLGQSEEAQRVLEEAISIYQKEYGTDHWKNGEARFFEALANLDDSNWQEIRSKLFKAMTILKNAVGTPQVQVDDAEQRFQKLDSENSSIKKLSATTHTLSEPSKKGPILE